MVQLPIYSEVSVLWQSGNLLLTIIKFYIKKEKTVSLLIRSGFSILEGIPSIRELNKRLYKINEREILINTDQRSIFLNGLEAPNNQLNPD